MSTLSPSERLAIDLERPLPGTWSIVAALSLVHLTTGMLARGRLSVLEALVLGRPDWLRIAAGGQTAELVQGGQLWRLVTSVFVHVDLLHLVLNGLAVLAVGRVLEPWFGASRMVGWFVLGGTLASGASHVTGAAQSDGASGGAFALLGVALMVGIRWKSRLEEQDARILGPVLQGLAILNLVLSFVVPGIDAVAHVAGLLVGSSMGALTADRLENR